MKNYALIENGIVINISIADDSWDSTGWVEYTTAGIGYTYDEINNVFIAPRPNCGHDELTLNTATYSWECTNIEHDEEL